MTTTTEHRTKAIEADLKSIWGNIDFQNSLRTTVIIQTLKELFDIGIGSSCSITKVLNSDVRVTLHDTGLGIGGEGDGIVIESGTIEKTGLEVTDLKLNIVSLINSEGLPISGGKELGSRKFVSAQDGANGSARARSSSDLRVICWSLSTTECNWREWGIVR